MGEGWEKWGKTEKKGKIGENGKKPEKMGKGGNQENGGMREEMGAKIGKQKKWEKMGGMGKWEKVGGNWGKKYGQKLAKMGKNGGKTKEKGKMEHRWAESGEKTRRKLGEWGKTW